METLSIVGLVFSFSDFGKQATVIVAILVVQDSVFSLLPISLRFQETGSSPAERGSSLLCLQAVGRSSGSSPAATHRHGNQWRMREVGGGSSCKDVGSSLFLHERQVPRGYCFSTFHVKTSNFICHKYLHCIPYVPGVILSALQILPSINLVR